MSELPVYFLTWTTYGTWLHGDPRGSVDDAHNQYQTPVLPHQEGRRRARECTLRESPLVLDHENRRIVYDTIERVCHRRNWLVHALNVRSNHVHLVVYAQSHRPERVMAQLKSWSTRDLIASGRLGSRERFWTRMGSTRWINDEHSLSAAVDYVLNHQ